jgi:hypothetical protein
MSKNLTEPATKTARGSSTSAREARPRPPRARPRGALQDDLRGAGYAEGRRLLSPDAPPHATRPGADPALQEIKARIGVSDPILLVTVPATTLARVIARGELSPAALLSLQDLLERADPAHAEAVRVLLGGYALAADLIGGPDIAMAAVALAKRMELIASCCDNEAHLAETAGAEDVVADIRAFQGRARVHARTMASATSSPATLQNRAALLTTLQQEYVSLSGEALFAHERQGRWHAAVAKDLQVVRDVLKKAAVTLIAAKYGARAEALAAASFDMLQEAADQFFADGPMDIGKIAAVGAASGIMSLTVERLTKALPKFLETGVSRAVIDQVIAVAQDKGQEALTSLLKQLLERKEIDREQHRLILSTVQTQG